MKLVLVIMKGKYDKTTDGGNSWERLYSGYPRGQILTSVFFIDENNGWCVGLDENPNGSAVLKTSDGGVTWQRSDFYLDLFSVFFIDQYIGWMIGENGAIYKSTNGGLNWVSQPSGINNTLYSIKFIDINNGWAVGDNGTILKLQIPEQPGLSVRVEQLLNSAQFSS